LKVAERVFEFQAPATDVFFRRGEPELIVGFDGVAGFSGWPAIDEDLSRHDGALGPFAALAKPALDQGLVQATHGARLI